MNLRALDLNLLVILDALLDEAHVSRAARRLNLSQPAVSNALQRCRGLFGDPLLERGRGTMRRTPKAESLRAPLRSLLANVADLIDPPEPVLKDIRQVIRVISADDPISLVASDLISTLQETAPGITIVFRSWQGADAAIRELLDGDADLAISVFDWEEENVARRTLFEEDYVVAMRRGHPAASNFCLDSWLEWAHVLVSGRGDLRSPLDARLKSLGRTRRVGIVVPSFQVVPRILLATDLIATMPRRSFHLHAEGGLVAFEPPIPTEGFPLHLGWHARHANDPGIRHVVETIATILAPAEDE
jgi:DNA-binding transcriptional LysR family regulator